MPVASAEIISDLHKPARPEKKKNMSFMIVDCGNIFQPPSVCAPEVRERAPGRNDAGEPAQHSVVDVRGKSEWEEHGCKQGVVRPHAASRSQTPEPRLLKVLNTPARPKKNACGHRKPRIDQRNRAHGSLDGHWRLKLGGVLFG